MINWILFIAIPTIALTFIASYVWPDPKSRSARKWQRARVGFALSCALLIALRGFVEGIQAQNKVEGLQSGLIKAIDKANELGRLQAWAGRLMVNSQIRMLRLAKTTTDSEQKLSNIDKSNDELIAALDHDSARIERMFRAIETSAQRREAYEGYLQGLDDVLKQDGQALLEDMEEGWSTANSLPIGDNPYTKVRKQLADYVTDLRNSRTDSENALSRLRLYLDLIHGIREAAIETHGRMREFVFEDRGRMLEQWLNGMNDYDQQLNERLQKYENDESTGPGPSKS